MAEGNSRNRSPERPRSSGAKSEGLTEVISVRSAEEARHAVSILNEWADDDETRLRRAIRAATGAANRAEAMTKRRTLQLSDKDKREMMRVAQTYRSYAERASQKLDRLRPKAAQRGGAGPRAGRGGRTIFFPPRHKALAEIITIRSPEEAKEAVRKLGEWADDDPDRVRTAIRSATLAANRALVSTKRKTRPLSREEMKEMLQVAEIYRSYTRLLSKKLDELKRRASAYPGSGRDRPGTRYPSQPAGQPSA
jgi:mevalonate kinase